MHLKSLKSPKKLFTEVHFCVNACSESVCMSKVHLTPIITVCQFTMDDEKIFYFTFIMYFYLRKRYCIIIKLFGILTISMKKIWIINILHLILNNIQSTKYCNNFQFSFQPAMTFKHTCINIYLSTFPSVKEIFQWLNTQHPVWPFFSWFSRAANR